MGDGDSISDETRIRIAREATESTARIIEHLAEQVAQLPPCGSTTGERTGAAKMRARIVSFLKACSGDAMEIAEKTS